MLRSLITFTLVMILVVTTASAQTAERLNGRSRLELRFGYAGISDGGTDVMTSVGITGVSVSYDGSGYMGGLAFSTWLEENLAVLISITGIGVGSTVESGLLGSSTSTISVGRLQLGMRYYLSGKNPTSSVRPYLAACAGPVFGDQSETKVDFTVSVSSHRESALGAYLGGGMDILASRKISFGAEVGYNLMTEFSEAIGGNKNYSGPEFGLHFGLLFGSAKP